MPIATRPRFPVLLAIMLLLAHHASGQGVDSRAMQVLRPGIAYIDTIRIGASDTLHLAHQFVQPGEYTIAIDSFRVLVDSVDFRIDRRFGEIVLTPRLLNAIGLLSRPTAIVRYRALPFSLPAVFRNRLLTVVVDSVNRDSLRVSSAVSPLNMETIFGPDLQKSGYIGRGFTLGTNRDLTLNSGFRLQLAGNLSKDISIVAALTDENTPIQPEGNTRTLQELDKVFIRMNSPHVAMTLGDFNLTFGDTEFGRYNRKLSGILGEVNFEDVSASASYASMKGSYHTNSFNGIDGVQGPYRLAGKNGEQRIVVIAGTEKVYVDGVEMTRGETNDYIIEYANGEITFRPRRIITAYSRIVVDFEYAAGEYLQSMFVANAAARLLDNRLAVTTRYIREADDPDSPIDIQLTDEDRRVLEQSGGNPRNTWRSGVVYAGRDTAHAIGAGQYVRVDTLVGGSPYVLYRYQPGIDSATYSVQFSFVGAGQGDYTRKTLGTFVFTGINSGDYAPVRILPLPRLLQSAVAMVDAHPLPSLSVNGEAAFSSLDKNRLALGDSAVDNGTALRLKTGWTSGKTNFGTITLDAAMRTISARFSPADRINQVEFDRKWDLTQSNDATESTVEGTVGYKPLDFVSSSFGVGSMRRGDFASIRTNGALAIALSPALPWLTAANYAFEHISSDDPGQNRRGSWLRQNGELQSTFGIVRPRVRFEQEYRTDRNIAGDTLHAASLAFTDIRPGIEFVDVLGMRFSADIGLRREDAVLRQTLVHQSDDLLQQYGWSVRSGADFSAAVSMTIRNRKFTEPFRLAGNQDLQTIITRMQSQYAPLKRAIAADLLYEVSTERTARLERVFWKVPLGQGGYIYKGDLNNNGVQDENEFEPTRFDGDYVLLTVPTDALFPVIDLKTGAKITLTPSRIIEPGASGTLAEIFRALSSETYIRIEENSRDPRTSNIYLLRTSTFLSDTNTIRGFQNIRQDLFLFDQKPEFSVRLRFDQRKGVTQYAAANERSFRREQSVRIRTQLVREIGLQTDLGFVTDNVASNEYSNRARAIQATTFVGDLSYRPWPRVEIGFVLNVKGATDNYQALGLDASINSQTFRTSITFDGPGRLRAEFERNEVAFSKTVDVFPFELTDGKPEGKSWVWRINLDYRLVGFIQSTLSYLGRSEGGTVIHTARAEVKAYF